MTEISLREYIETHLEAQAELHRSQREADQEAVKIALANSKELAEKHNDLIRQMERKDETYATKEQVGRVEAWQSRLTGAIVLLGGIGVANLVKLWTN